MKTLEERVREHVANGAAYLDRESGPTWIDDIDLETLDLGDGECCILGQLGHNGAFGELPVDDLSTTYYRVCTKIKPRVDPDGPTMNRLGFCSAHWIASEGYKSEYALPTAEWSRVIRERRAAAS